MLRTCANFDAVLCACAEEMAFNYTTANWREASEWEEWIRGVSCKLFLGADSEKIKVEEWRCSQKKEAMARWVDLWSGLCMAGDCRAQNDAFPMKAHPDGATDRGV